jgi:DNA-binding NtrC family response regulator
MVPQPASVPSVRRLRVVLAEDDHQMRRLIADVIRRDGHFVIEASDGAALLQHLRHAFWGDPTDADHSVIVADVRMPRGSGLVVLEGIRSFDWCPPCILITAFPDIETHREAERLGVHAVLSKPFDLDRLRTLVAEIAQRPARFSARP